MPKCKFPVEVIALLALGCGAATEQEEPAGQGLEPLTLGSAQKIVRKTAATCIDVNANATANGTKVQQLACSGAASQTFRPEAMADGSVKLVHVSSGKCVDVSASGTANGTKVQLWTCNGTGAQSFFADDVGGGFARLRNKTSNKCVDVSGNQPTNGIQLQIWTCNGTDAQSWQFVPLETTPPPVDSSAEQACVDKINALRAGIGMGPLARWTDNEVCADNQCQSDSISGQAHGAFGTCPNWAQNECPGWPSVSSIYSGNSCLDAMWREGPGEPYEAHGHYINMTNPSYTKVSCGFFTTPAGKVWAVQDFR